MLQNDRSAPQYRSFQSELDDDPDGSDFAAQLRQPIVSRTVAPRRSSRRGVVNVVHARIDGPIAYSLYALKQRRSIEFKCWQLTFRTQRNHFL